MSDHGSSRLSRVETIWNSLGHTSGGIGWRLLVRVLLVSSAITLLLTLMQLYLDYRRDIGAIDRGISEIVGSYQGSLGEGLWRLDARQLQLQAEGILRLPDVNYVEVREVTDHGAPFIVTAGFRRANAPVRREFTIFYRDQDAERLLGILSVEATFDRIYRELLDTAAVIVVGQSIKTFIVSFFILLVVHRLITRHLAAIAMSLRGYHLHPWDTPFRLARRPPRRADELDQLAGALNDMCFENSRLYRDLADREGKIRRLVDANIIGIFIWDFDGRILEANDAFLHIVGYDHEDLVAGRLRWTDLTPQEWRERDMQLIQEQKLTGTLQPFEKEYFRKDGSRVPVLMGVATFEERGNQGVAFVLDLTERKRAEERLRVQHTVAQIVAEAVTIEEATPRILRAMGECLGWDVGALWSVDRKAEALRCVELWRRASIEVPEFERVSRESTFVPGLGLPGRVWSRLEPEYVPDVVPDENFPRGPIAEREELHAALAFPVLFGGEALGVIEFFSREIKQPDQELLNVLAAIGSQIGQFIERKRAEEALRELQSTFAHMNRVGMMGELAASLSHEITQPIASARNNVHAAENFLKMQPPDLHEVGEALACVVGDVNRAGDIVGRIREHMKRAPLRKDRFALDEAIREVIALARTALTKNGVSVQTRLTEGLLLVYGDRIQLQQVILNLILNAVEAMDSDGAGARELLISSEADDTGVLVAVRDTGPGIDPMHLERIFEAFYTTKSGGMGMGLSVCRSIIDAHGGRLWAELNEPRGAVFQFTLPDAENDLTNGEPRGNVSTVPHQQVCEGNR